MNARRTLTALAVAAMALGLPTCDSTDPPTPGWVDLRLTSPNIDDGGLLFTVGGARIDSVRSILPGLFVRRESATAMRVAVVGNVGPGVVAQIWVPDSRGTAAYAVTVLEAAARVTFVQRPVAGYALTVVRP